MRAPHIAILVALGAALLATALLIGGSPEAGGTPSVVPATAEDSGWSPAIEDPLVTADLPSVQEAPDPRTASAESPVESSEPDAGGLRVRVRDAASGAAVARFWIRRSGIESMESPPAPALSDPESGEARLPGASWDVPTGGPTEHATAEFLISSPLYEPTVVSLAPPAGASAIETLSLKRAAAIVGTVYDGSSAPLKSARVSLEFYPGPEAMGEAAGETQSAEDLRELARSAPSRKAYSGPTLRRTDASGAFAFGQLPPGRFRVHVEAGGAERTSDWITVEPGQWTHANQWFDEHVRLTVTVAQPTGEPAEGSRLLLISLAETFQGDVSTLLTEDDVLPAGCSIAATRYTDADGRALLGPLAEATYALLLQSDDGAAAPQTLVVRSDGPTSLEHHFRLEEPPGDPNR